MSYIYILTVNYIYVVAFAVLSLLIFLFSFHHFRKTTPSNEQLHLIEKEYYHILSICRIVSSLADMSICGEMIDEFVKRNKGKISESLLSLYERSLRTAAELSYNKATSILKP